MFFSLTYLSIVFATFLTFCDCIEPLTTITTLGALIASVGFAGYKYMICNINECCNGEWMKYDHYGLETDIGTNLFGQHLVKFIVLKSLKAHIQKKKPKKALVMAFHGDTGSGKNHVSKMIMEHLFKKGSESQYGHLYIAAQHFPHKQEVNKYKDELRKQIEEHTSKCERSLFIFDEVDKMPPGVLDALTPYLDYHEKVDGIDYRKNIFIFLSNAGAKNITKIALKFWADGKDREEISLKDIEHLITSGAFNEEGGLKYSEIVKRELIDVYVPFLPMEKKHVMQCVQAELNAQNKKGDIKMIADQLLYYPPEAKLFSTSGCKKVTQKVDLFAS